MVKRLAAVVTVCVLLLPAVAGQPSDAEKAQVEEWARSLDRATVHKAVLDHEKDPLSKDSRKKLRPVLVVHFEPVDYIVCLDQIGSLMEDKDVGHAVMWQVVFGSGDFVEANPDKATDKFAYMLAGLESGLRAYENILAQKPKAKIPLLDNLLALRKEGRLMEFVQEKPCDPK